MIIIVSETSSSCVFLLLVITEAYRRTRKWKAARANDQTSLGPDTLYLSPDKYTSLDLTNPETDIEDLKILAQLEHEVERCLCEDNEEDLRLTTKQKFWKE